MAVEDKVVLLDKDCVMLVVVEAGQGQGSCGLHLVYIGDGSQSKWMR